MATTEDIKNTILRVAGNPVAGPIAALASEMAEAIVELDAPSNVRGDQRRVIEPVETRVVLPSGLPESDD